MKYIEKKNALIFTGRFLRGKKKECICQNSLVLKNADRFFEAILYNFFRDRKIKLKYNKEVQLQYRLYRLNFVSPVLLAPRLMLPDGQVNRPTQRQTHTHIYAQTSNLKDHLEKKNSYWQMTQNRIRYVTYMRHKRIL